MTQPREPVWDGDGTDPWLPTRLAHNRLIVSGERSVYDDWFARVSRWLVEVNRGVVTPYRIEPNGVWRYVPQWLREMTELVRETIAPIVGRVYEQIFGEGYRYDLRPYVVQYLAEVQNRLVYTPAEVYDLIVGEIAEGSIAGESIQQLAARIELVLSATATPRWQNRATTVARTECLIGETLIESDGIEAVYRRWYEGPTVRIHMASGHEFTCTPNHPILTPLGWVTAGVLQPGDQMAQHGGGQGLRAAGDVHISDMPATLSEVYNALAAVGVVVRTQAGQPDFHGDGTDGYVDVAVANRELADRLEAAQHVGDLGFESSDGGSRVLLGGGRPVAVDPIVAFANGDAERLETSLNGAKVSSVFDRQIADAGPPQVLLRQLVGIELDSVQMLSAELAMAGLQRVACGTKWHTCRLQNSSDHAIIHPVLFGQSSSASASPIVGNDRRMIQIASGESCSFGLGTQRYPGVGQYGADTAGVDAEALLNGVDALTRPIGVDHVVRVDRVPFVGHVYNLSTKRGWFGVGPFYSGNTIGAYNAGREGAFNQVATDLDEPFDHVWLATHDLRTRYYHRQADLQRVPLGQPFIVMGERLMRPGDPRGSASNVINCRCTTLLMRPNEEIDLSNRQFEDF